MYMGYFPCASTMEEASDESVTYENLYHLTSVIKHQRLEISDLKSGS